VAAIRAEIESISRKRNLGSEVELLQEFGSTACARGLMEQMERAVERQGFPARRLPSGAGHDGMALAAIADICMLFVRCKGGISHSPLEAISEADAAAGARVLFDFIEHFRLPA
jgi:allantoate deiminase